MDIKRPSNTENEDDILRFQEEFLKSKEKECVTIVKVPGSKRKSESQSSSSTSNEKSKSSSSPIKKSKFKQERENKAKEKKDEEERLDYLRADDAMKEENHITSVMSSTVIEKDFVAISWDLPTKVTKEAFPVVPLLKDVSISLFFICT